MIPGQRKLVERLADKPFTILGINSDGMSRSALTERLNKEQITWPQIAEGQERAISQKWNVQAFPTIYVLDHQGVIRARGFLNEGTIEGLVEDLLEEMDAAH